jgi:hypothetical protein
LTAAAAIATILVTTALSAVIHPDGHAVVKVALKRAGHAMPHTTFVPDDLNYATNEFSRRQHPSGGFLVS